MPIRPAISRSGKGPCGELSYSDEGALSPPSPVPIPERGCVRPSSCAASMTPWHIDWRLWRRLASAGALCLAAIQGRASAELALDFSPREPSQLGAFQIVINAGATLAENLPALQAFQRAAARWEALISDPIVVTIDADLGSLGAGVLGSASAVRLFAPFATIRNAMVADAADEPDDAVVAALPTTPSFTLPDGFATDGNLQLTKANAKALNFVGLDQTFGVSDGSIEFNLDFSFDYDNSDGVAPGFFDFESVAAHEIGHILGFFSDVDFIDVVMSLGGTSSEVRPTTVDMFRFADGGSDDPETVAEFSSNPRSLVPGVSAVFDQILGADGALAEIPMATGLTQGDGRQASHWKDNLGLGLLGPSLAPGQIVGISANDARALDLIGYEISFSVVAIPEARAYLMAAGVAGLVGMSHVGGIFR